MGNRGRFQRTPRSRRSAHATLLIEKLVAEDVAIYGVTTGIGELGPRAGSRPSRAPSSAGGSSTGHSAGTGDPFPPDSVRAAMLLRANVLSRGCSGVRLSLIDTVIQMINKGVIPYINEKGSLGVSGDLSPMSQFAEVALGEGPGVLQGASRCPALTRCGRRASSRRK